MRRHGAALILVGLALVAVVALAVSGAGDRHPRAFALGVSPQAVIAPLAPDSPACQGPITVPAAFDTLDIALGTFGRPGPPLRVSVRGAGVARSARIPAAYEGDQAHVRVTFALVPAGRRISVCVANLGRRRIGVLGAPDAATYESHLSLGGRRFHADAAIEFERTHPSPCSTRPARWPGARASSVRDSWGRGRCGYSPRSPSSASGPCSPSPSAGPRRRPPSPSPRPARSSPASDSPAPPRTESGV